MNTMASGEALASRDRILVFNHRKVYKSNFTRAVNGLNAELGKDVADRRLPVIRKDHGNMLRAYDAVVQLHSRYQLFREVPGEAAAEAEIVTTQETYIGDI